MDISVADDPQRSQYAVTVDGAHAGLAAYSRDGDRVVFTHTEVDPRHEGHGVGSALVRAALEDVRSRGLTAVPQCSFVRSYLRSHPDLADAAEA